MQDKSKRCIDAIHGRAWEAHTRFGNEPFKRKLSEICWHLQVNLDGSISMRTKQKVVGHILYRVGTPVALNCTQVWGVVFVEVGGRNHEIQTSR